MADYGHAHRKLREWWAPYVEAGTVDCARCSNRIEPGTPWDLGHDDDNPDEYNGPEHRGCNRTAGGIKRDGMWGRPDNTQRWVL